jgi:soluble cytochrome b562
MALTSTEEALVRQLLAQQAAILSLAGNEATIMSKLSAMKVTLSDLVSATSTNFTDLFLVRQGTNEKSLTYQKLIDELLSDLDLASYAKLAAAQSFTKAQRGAEVSLPATTGTVTLDLSLANNFGGTLTGNITLANPTNIVTGQSGVLRIVNDSTPRTIAYGSFWKSIFGVLPALTASAGATDDLVYYVESATRITVTALGDTK